VKIDDAIAFVNASNARTSGDDEFGERRGKGRAHRMRSLASSSCYVRVGTRLTRVDDVLMQAVTMRRLQGFLAEPTASREVS